jgi:predicted nicotinamide N-methyase
LPRATPPLWRNITIANQHFQMLNLDHPRITARIIDDMDAGVEVYYDRRWRVTECFCRFLLADPSWVANRSVLILGAGLGLETLVIGQLCQTLYLNDLAPAALDLCSWQLRRNGITDFSCLLGRYETLPLPSVDLIAGCFLVYNRETATAMRQFLDCCAAPVLLMNDPMPDWYTLMREVSRPRRFLLPPDGNSCILFT